MLTTYMSKTIFQRLGFIYVTSKFLQQHGRTESHFAPNLVMRIQFGLQTACILHMFISGYIETFCRAQEHVSVILVITFALRFIPSKKHGAKIILIQ